MKTCFIALLLIIGLWSCKPSPKKERIYYIYNSKSIFQVREVNHDSIHYVCYDAVRILDVIPQGLNQSDKRAVTYSLHHHLKWGKYRDTSFIKHKTYLDSIEFYGTEWLKKNDNLDNFWETVQSGWPDTLKIYVFEPIKGSDSLIFKRVHRYFYCPDD